VTILAPRLGFIEPMKPALVDEAPPGDDWLHELKYDGYRTELVLSGSDARAFTRTGLDWTDKYRGITTAAGALGCNDAILDGEVIVQDRRGLSDFRALRTQLARKKPVGLIFMAFDLLHLDGRDLRRGPVEDRRERLRKLLGANDPERPIQYSDHVAGGGPGFFAAAEAMGMEGIVSKRIGSRYRSGASRSWLKTKAFTEEEFVVIGTSTGDLAPMALLARETEDHRLEYAGAAMVTFSEAEREIFWRANERLKVAKPALHMEPRPETGWLKPEIRVIVRHLRGEEMLRHATVKSISHLPKPSREARHAPNRPQQPPTKEPGHTVEHGAIPERQALLAYYRDIAPLILPHLDQRPLNLFRCHDRYCFFQRNRTHPQTSEPFDAPICKIPILQKNGKTEEYLYIQDAAGLLACVQADTVEFHAWGSRIPGFERPDRIAFDLDPGDGVTFEQVKDAALQMRQSLDAIGLDSWPMVTGGKGIHVVLPFRPQGEWPQVRAFARQFCAALAEAEPDLYTIALPKAQRRGRIFLDFLRNQRTATAVMPYSVRARPGSPVAAPVGWDELAELPSPAIFNIAHAQELKRRAKSKGLRSWGSADQDLPA
jgi:bifunctional non-homologous end joining protein LigD